MTDQVPEYAFPVLCSKELISFVPRAVHCLHVVLCRCPTCPLSWLSLTHCGLDDRDGARILDALTPATCKLSYSSSSGAIISSSSCSSKDGCPLQSNWSWLDLSYNSLEGGAALVAAAVITAFVAEAGSVNTATGRHQQQGAPSNARTMSASRFDAGDSTSASSSLRSRYSSVIASRILLLDGNPLGVSGVRCIARALAGQPSVGVLAAIASSRNSIRVDSTAAGTTSNSAVSEVEAEASLALAETVEQQQQGQQQLSLHVGIAKVTLVAKEKGVRASMRDSHASVVTASQVGWIEAG